MTDISNSNTNRIEAKIDVVNANLVIHAERLATLEAKVDNISGSQSFAQQVVLQMLPQVVSGLILLGGIMYAIKTYGDDKRQPDNRKKPNSSLIIKKGVNNG